MTLIGAPLLRLLVTTAAFGLTAMACSTGSGITVIGEEQATGGEAAEQEAGLCELARAVEAAADDYSIGPRGGLEGSADRYLAAFERLAGEAPADLREDMSVVVGYTAASLAIHEDIDLEGGGEEIASLFEATAAIDAEYGDVGPSFDRVEKFFGQECGVDLGLSGSSGPDPRIELAEPDAVDDVDLGLSDIEGTGDTELGAGVDSNPGTFGDDEALDSLWTACADGDLDACDDLYFQSPFGSEYESFGSTCGGVLDEPTFGGCAVALGDGDEPSFDPPPGSVDAFGDDPGLDVLWVACEDGVFDACDDLYLTAVVLTGYEFFGSTCGGRTDELAGGCAAELGSDEGLDIDAERFGDDPGNDALYLACEDGNLAACDTLFFNSGFGSEYEAFASSCGGRRDSAFDTSCVDGL